MAIDTEDKRRSVTGIPPIADSTISLVDRRHATYAYLYRYTTAAAAVWSNIEINGIDVITGNLVYIIGKYRA
jgi:hypothetical protein